MTHIEVQLVCGHATGSIEGKEVIDVVGLTVDNHVFHGVSVQEVISICHVTPVVVECIYTARHHNVGQGQVAGDPALISVFDFVGFVFDFNAFAGVAKQSVGDVST